MDKQEIINILTRQIDFFYKQEEKPGWTKWALITAIIYTGYFLINTIEKGIFDKIEILNICLLLFISYDGIFLLYRLLFTSNQLSNENNRFNSSIDDYIDKNKAILNVFKLVIIFFLIFQSTLRISLFIKIFYVLYSLIIILYLVSSLVFLPLAKKIDNNKITPLILNIVTLFFSILLTSFCVRAFSRLLLEPSPFIFISFKIAGSIFIICWLAYYLIEISSVKSVLYLKLNDIVKKLDFGIIEPNSAFEQADILINGRKLGHILEKKVSNIVSLLESIEGILKNMSNLFSEIQKNSDKEKIDIFLKYSDYAEKKVDTAIKKYQSLMIWCEFIERNSPDFAYEIKEIKTKISVAVNKVSASSKEIKANAQKTVGTLAVDLKKNS